MGREALQDSTVVRQRPGTICSNTDALRDPVSLAKENSRLQVSVEMFARQGTKMAALRKICSSL